MVGQILAIIVLVAFTIFVITAFADMLLIGFGIVAAFVVLRLLWMSIGSRK